RHGPRETRRRRLHLASSFERSGKRDFIGILEITADRQSARQASYSDPERPHQTMDIHRRCLALEVRVRRQQDFRDCARAKPPEQLAYPKILWPNAVDRRDRTVQDVVETTVRACALQRQHVKRLLDDTYSRMVASWIFTQSTGIN